MNPSVFPFPTFLAEALPATPSNEEIAWQLLLVFLLVLLKGVFVAAEFSLVKVRASQIDELMQEGKASSAAMRAKAMVHKLEDYVGATQFGITLTSIALSMFGEKYIVAWLNPNWKQCSLYQWRDPRHRLRPGAARPDVCGRRLRRTDAEIRGDPPLAQYCPHA